MQLREQIIHQIQLNGSISVAEFMQICLFDPKNGYYTNRQPFGSAGDFITSPEISQCFGEVIALYCVHYFNETQGEIQIVELGPGRGVLMADMLRTFRKFPGFYHRVSVHLVEKSHRLREVQQEKLQEFGQHIKHYDEFNQLPKKPSFIISNELLDCLPMQQYEFSNGKWFERKIAYKDDLHFCLLSTPSSVIYPKMFLQGYSNSSGDIFEVSPSTISFITEVANFIKLTKSRALFIDYGYSDYEFKPTIQALKSHQYQDLFVNLGEQDITYLVNFPIILETLEQLKACNFSLYNQGDFLLSLGLKTRIEMCKKAKSKDLQDKLDQSLYRLTDKAQMGELFKVLELC